MHVRHRLVLHIAACKCARAGASAKIRKATSAIAARSSKLEKARASPPRRDLQPRVATLATRSATYYRHRSRCVCRPGIHTPRCCTGRFVGIPAAGSAGPLWRSGAPRLTFSSFLIKSRCHLVDRLPSRTHCSTAPSASRSIAICPPRWRPKSHPCRTAHSSLAAAWGRCGRTPVFGAQTRAAYQLTPSYSSIAGC